MKREIRRETQSEGYHAWVSQEEMPSINCLIDRVNKTQLFFSQIICLNNDMSIDLVKKLEEIYDQFMVRRQNQVFAWKFG